MKLFTTVILAIVLWITATMRISAAYDVPTNGLIGYWPGDGDASDVSSTQNGGSFGGSYAIGPTGGAFDLSTGKVSIANNAAYNFHSYAGWSVGFWFNCNGTPISGGNPALFIGQDNGSGYQPKWFIDYGYTVYGPNSDYIFHVNDYNTERIFVASDSESSPPGWNQLTVTVDTVNNGTVTFYLNGQPIGQAAMGPYVLETGAPIIFGSAEGLSFNGLMSDVVIYDRVLSTNEVAQLATIPSPLFTLEPTNLIVSYGQPATFTALATDDPPVSYQWQFDGTNIIGATNSSLTVYPTSVTNIGVYDVIAFNPFGTNTSTSATLSFLNMQCFPGLVLYGPIGSEYTIESAPTVESTNWTAVTNVELTSMQPYIYIDYTAITNQEMYYRAVPIPAIGSPLPPLMPLLRVKP